MKFLIPYLLSAACVASVAWWVVNSVPGPKVPDSMLNHQKSEKLISRN